MKYWSNIKAVSEQDIIVIMHVDRFETLDFQNIPIEIAKTIVIQSKT